MRMEYKMNGWKELEIRPHCFANIKPKAESKIGTQYILVGRVDD